MWVASMRRAMDSAVCRAPDVRLGSPSLRRAFAVAPVAAPPPAKATALPLPARRIEAPPRLAAVGGSAGVHLQRPQAAPSAQRGCVSRFLRWLLGVDRLEARLDAIEARLDLLEARFVAFEARLESLIAASDARIQSRFHSLESRVLTKDDVPAIIRATERHWGAAAVGTHPTDEAAFGETPATPLGEVLRAAAAPANGCDYESEDEEAAT